MISQAGHALVVGSRIRVTGKAMDNFGREGKIVGVGREYSAVGEAYEICFFIKLDTGLYRYYFNRELEVVGQPV